MSRELDRSLERYYELKATRASVPSTATVADWRCSSGMAALAMALAIHFAVTPGCPASRTAVSLRKRRS